MTTNNTKQLQSAEKRKPPAAGKGRVKGTPNKVTGEVKQMVLDALAGLGGVDYLMQRGKENPAAFLTLVGKVIPLQVNGAGDNGEHLTNITIKLVGGS